MKELLNLTPKEIVKELDRFIVGQEAAKRAIAIAFCNRYRRKNVSPELQDEIMPKNILMIGPTGVGKTEIARRLAKLAGLPFIKVEATKFTEVGYVGRDTESIIRDLVDIAVNMIKTNEKQKIASISLSRSIEKVLDALVGRHSENREQVKQDVLSGKYDNTEIEIQIQDNAFVKPQAFDIPGMPHGIMMGVANVSDMINKTFGAGQQKTKTKKMTVKEALSVLTHEISSQLIDEDKCGMEAVHSVETGGIVFIDEIDKIISTGSRDDGKVSREGVQRDLLPLVEGTVVNTKYGSVKTDHILFIAAGAFSIASPSDLMAELQGRLPIRVELRALSKQDLVRILTEPKANLIEQYIALLGTESVELEFTDDAKQAIADMAEKINFEVENIGARRLFSIMEKLLEDVSFNASDLRGQKVIVDAIYVQTHLKSLHMDIDTSKFIL